MMISKDLYGSLKLFQNVSISTVGNCSKKQSFIQANQYLLDHLNWFWISPLWYQYPWWADKAPFLWNLMNIDWNSRTIWWNLLYFFPIRLLGRWQFWWKAGFIDLTISFLGFGSVCSASQPQSLRILAVVRRNQAKSNLKWLILVDSDYHRFWRSGESANRINHGILRNSCVGLWF